MIQTQTYSPDTCSCIVEEQYDDSINEGQRLMSLKSIIKRCSFHTVILDLSLYSTIREENNRKNKAIVKAAEVLSVSEESIPWTFDNGRTLRITLAVSASKKQQIQTWCDQNLGIGMVVIS